MAVLRDQCITLTIQETYTADSEPLRGGAQRSCCLGKGRLVDWRVGLAGLDERFQVSQDLRLLVFENGFVVNSTMWRERLRVNQYLERTLNAFIDTHRFP